MNRNEEIEARLSAITTEMEADGADLDALEAEVRSLKEERQKLIDDEAKRVEMRKAIAEGREAYKVIEDHKEEKKMEERTYAVNTPEYREAWLKRMWDKPLSAVEQRAYSDANGAISEITANKIIEKVKDIAPLLARCDVIPADGNVTVYVEGTVTAAEDHTEDANITADADTVTPVELSPAEITKLCKISRRAKFKSIDSFEAYLVKTISEAIVSKINSKIITAATTAATSAGTGITKTSVLAMLGAVKGNNDIVICNKQTLFTKLADLQDNSKSTLLKFEGKNASIYGRPVLVDDNMADNTLLCGDFSKMACAMAENVDVVPAFDIDHNAYKYLGVALFACGVGQASAFSKVVAGA